MEISELHLLHRLNDPDTGVSKGGVSGQLHNPVHFIWGGGEEPPVHDWTGGSVGPRAGLDVVAKRKIPVHTSNRTSVV
jgi:hypothetical protein